MTAMACDRDDTCAWRWVVTEMTIVTAMACDRDDT